MAIRKADGVERVYDQLKRMAMEFSFEPGQKVKEGVLAKELGVSRTPVREALNRLVTEGFMTFIPNRGFFCRGIDLDEITQLYQIRAALEVWSFRTACAEAPDTEIKSFCRRWGSKRTAGTFDTLDIYDAEFHHALANLSRTPLLVKQLREINEKIKVFRNLELQDARRRRMTLNEHQQIVTSLLEKDAVNGVQLLERHILRSADNAIAAAKLRLSAHLTADTLFECLE